MRNIGLLCVLATAGTLAVSAAQAATSGPDDGCLVVRSGRGIVSINAKGFVFGRFDTGYVDIDDPVQSDGTVKVFGATRIRFITETKTRYIGLNLRFRASGLFRVRLEAVSIDLSVAGKGQTTLSANDFLDAGTFSVDAESFCNTGFRPMPDVLTRYPIAAQSTG